MRFLCQDLGIHRESKSASMRWWPNNFVWTLMKMAIISYVQAKDHNRFFDWRVAYGHTYGHAIIPYKLTILINGQYPGPEIYAVTNDNLIINVHNDLDVPFLLSWNGLHLKKNSFQDGVYGTTCPIPPGENYTYVIQVKDQTGTFFYFPSLDMQKAAGGFGAIRILSRPHGPLPFPEPAGDFTFLISDGFYDDYRILKALLDRGRKLPSPLTLMNGQGLSDHPANTLTVHKGKTYRLRISNVGVQNTLNFEVMRHQMKLVEVEGTYTVQKMYPSLDIHVGQSYSVLVTMNQPAHPEGYRIHVSIKFGPNNASSGVSSILRYANSTRSVSSSLVQVEQPDDDTERELELSMMQARSIKTNLTADGPRGSPQGAYRYGRMKVYRTLILENSEGIVKKKQRYAINGVSFVPADTPLKLADYFKIKDVFKVGSIPDKPKRGKMRMDTSVMGAENKAFVEIIFQNREKDMQSYHLDGYNFWVVGMDRGTWSKASRRQYNLKDAIFRSTTQVYPESWTAVYVRLDNVGMWNLRSQDWARRYLGQQFYLRVYSPSNFVKNEDHLPKNALLCGRANKHGLVGYSSRDIPV